MGVLLVGIKLTAVKELVQLLDRQKELKANLSLVRRRLEDEDLVEWLDDVTHGAAHREARIEAMESASGHVLSTMESELFQVGVGMFDAFESRDADTTQLNCSARINRSTKYDKASGLQFGRVEAEIRATPQDIVAYMLDYDGIKSDDATTTVRAEMLEAVNPFHTIIFNRKKAPGIRDRSFLNAVIAQKLAHSPLTYALVGVPIAKHDRITSKDEAGAVRAESCRSFRCTEVAPCRTKMEYVCSLDLKGFVPQWITNKFAVPELQHPPQSLKTYFQQLLPLADCDAGDGRVVGQLLLDLVDSEPNELEHAIRTFANRTAMLRECGCRHIGTMLASLLASGTASSHQDSKKGLKKVAASKALPVHHSMPQTHSSLTEQQAAAVGSTIASTVRRSDMPATALHKLVNSLEVLQTMRSAYVWFVPMLEVLTAPKVGKPRRSTLMKRLSSIVATEQSAPNYVTKADETDAESFGSVVWLGMASHTPVACNYVCMLAVFRIPPPHGLFHRLQPKNIPG